MFPTAALERTAVEGQQRLQAGDWRGARGCFEVVTRAMPGYAPGWVQLAATYHAEGRPRETADYLRRALPLTATAAGYLSLLRSAEQFYIDAACPTPTRTTAEPDRPRSTPTLS
jgi:hypothetical protein